MGAGHDPANRVRLATVMYHLLETIRICATLLMPFMPESAEKIFDQIGACQAAGHGRRPTYGAPCAPTPRSTRARPCFPVSTPKRRWQSWRSWRLSSARPLPALEVEPYTEENVDFDTFCKSDLRAVKIKNCEPVKKERQAAEVHAG